MSRRSRNKKQRIWEAIATIVVTICIIVLGYINQNVEIPNETNNIENKTSNTKTENIISNSHTLEDIPAYIGQASITINENKPFFEESDFTEEPFEKYSKLDEKGRCGVAFANICTEIMPEKDEKRESISQIKNLSGWVQKEYPSIIGTRYLYNRCHLIGWQLSAENANIQNLMTGTAYLNYAMLDYENKVAEYIKESEKIGNDYHVLYRVTPIFEGDNKLANRSRNRSSICGKER